MPMERVLLCGMILVLVAAPLPFGSVQPAVAAALAASCLALGVIWVVWRARSGLAPLPWNDPLLIAGALFAFVGLLQTIPIPRPALAAISPKAAELRRQYEPAWRPATDATSPRAEAAATPQLEWRPITLYPWATRQATLRFVAFLLTALITLDLASRSSARRALVAALLASGGFQAVYGLAEYFSGHQQIFVYVKKYYTDVATGTFINRNHFAGYLEMTLPLAIALAGAALSGVRARAAAPAADQVAATAGEETDPTGRRLFAAAGLLILALTMATALACSRSRMGIASILMALLSVGLYLAWRGRGKGFAVATAAVVGAAAVLFSQGESAAPIVDRFLWAADEFKGTVGRGSIWDQAAGMFAAFPVAGVGLGAFSYVFPIFRTAGSGVYLDHAHNDFLELATEVGTIGCATALLGVALVAWTLLRHQTSRPDFGYLGPAAAAGLAAIAFHSLTDFNLAIPSNALTFAVLVGIVACWMRVPVPALAAGSRSAAPRPWFARAVAPAAVLAAGMLVAVGPALANVSALSAIDAGDAARQFEMAARASEPVLSDLQVLVQTQAAGGDPSATAGEYIEKRIEAVIGQEVDLLRRLPTLPEGHIALGRLEIARCAATDLAGSVQENCLPRALGELQAGLRLGPMNADLHAQVARLLIASWPVLDEAERQAAGAVIERAVEMNRGDPSLAGNWAAIRAMVAPLSAPPG